MASKQYVPGMQGCLDGSCIFTQNKGMVTNGGCSCSRELMRTEAGLMAVRTIQYMRRNWPEESDCNRPEGCVCGGDTLRVRQGCGWYVA